jgi:chromosome segregation ATPase
MLSDDDHPGLLTFLVGMIVLVMTGVVLSMLVDSRFGASKKVTALREDIETGDAEIGRLRNLQAVGVLRLTDEEPARRKAAADLHALRRRMKDLDARRKVLEASDNDLLTSISAIEADFGRYRGRHREIADRSDQNPGKTLPKARETAVDIAAVNRLRARIDGWKVKVAALERDSNRAFSEAASGSSASTPGSLETWQARAARLAGELARAKAALAGVKADLAAVAPNDPALRPDFGKP